MARPSSGLIVCDEAVGDYALTGLSESFRIPMSKHALNSTFDSFSPKRKQTMRFRRWVLHVLMYGNNISMHSLWAMNRNFTYPNLPKSLHVPVTEPSRVWAIDSWLAVIVASALQALVDGRNPKSPTCRGTPQRSTWWWTAGAPRDPSAAFGCENYCLFLTFTTACICM